ncbi:MAG TPA: PPOX class F420-dependent oxidoreductase [Nitrososphaera sp.]|nr:PPOX class F420-dependent oxidoreductase [Nitrososphaera sp.]
MSEDTIRSEPVSRLFQGKNFGFLATLMEDGSPQVTPVWVDYDEGNIMINTAEGRVKQRNVTRNPKVAVSVTDSTNPYTMVTVRGTITEQTNQGADEHIDKMAKKYLGVDKYPFRAQGEKRILLRMKPERVFYMSP